MILIMPLNHGFFKWKVLLLNIKLCLRKEALKQHFSVKVAEFLFSSVMSYLTQMLNRALKCSQAKIAKHSYPRIKKCAELTNKLTRNPDNLMCLQSQHM